MHVLKHPITPILTQILTKILTPNTLPGDGWSGGVTTYLRHGCVPVVVQDGVDMPFERVGAFRGSVDGGDDGDGDGAEALLRWASFSIRVAGDGVDGLGSILRGGTESEIRRLQDGVAAVWRMFWYDVQEQPAFGQVSLFLFLFLFACGQFE